MGSERLISPDAVEHVAVGEYADVHVGHDDVVEVALALVGKEQVGHPHLFRVVQRQVLDSTCRYLSMKIS